MRLCRERSAQPLLLRSTATTPPISKRSKLAFLGASLPLPTAAAAGAATASPLPPPALGDDTMIVQLQSAPSSSRKLRCGCAALRLCCLQGERQGGRRRQHIAIASCQRAIDAGQPTSLAKRFAGGLGGRWRRAPGRQRPSTKVASAGRALLAWAVAGRAGAGEREEELLG